MANWRYVLCITHIINGDDAEVAAEQMVALLRKHERRIAEVWRLKGFPTKRFITRFEKVKSTAAFNRVLNDMYDSADSFFIWLDNFGKRKSGPIEYRLYRYRGKRRFAVTGPDGKTRRYDAA